MKYVLSELPPRLGGLDMLMPIFLEMKRYHSVYIEVIILETELKAQLEKDIYLLNQFRSCVDRITFFDKQLVRVNTFAPFSKAQNIFRLVSLFIRILFGKSAPTFLHASSFNSKLTKLLSLLIKFRGGITIGHFRLMAGGRLLDENVNASPGSSHKSVSKSFDGYNLVEELYGDHFLVFNIDNVESWNPESKEKCVEVGYTRVYRSWTEKLKRDAAFHRENSSWFPDFKGTQPFSLIYLPSTLKNVFDEEELEDWLTEIIPVIAEKFPDSAIVLKPHPMQKMAVVEKVVSKFSKFQCLVSFVHPGLLAAAARLVVSHHSTTIIDAMALNVPVIHHQKYTGHWMERHPSGPALLDYGQIKTSDIRTFAAELDNTTCITSSRDSLIKNMNHCDKIENLFKIMGIPRKYD